MVFCHHRVFSVDNNLKRLTAPMDGLILDKKTALITGAGRGIGKTIALELAAQGANICFTNLHLERGAAVKKEILSLGRKCLHLVADCGDAKVSEDVVKQCLAQFASIDILVNNAGITRDGLVMRMPVEDWREVMRVNLDGMFYMSKPVARTMMKQRSGRIINITSVVGFTGNAGQINYCSSKSAAVGFTKSLAKELGSRGVTCNAVAPGFINTDMTAVLGDGQRKALLGQIALGRMGDAKEIAQVVCFLAGPGASYISGEVIHVNGGMY